MSTEDLRLAAILHAEIADPDSLLARGKEEAIQAFSSFHEASRRIAEATGGSLLSALRGEVVIAFSTSAAAIDAALQIFSSIGTSNNHTDKTDSSLPSVRIGISIGDILFTPAGAFGKAADIAEELVRAVPHGGLCVSADAWRASHPSHLRANPVRLELPDQSRLDAFIVENAIPSSASPQTAATIEVPKPQSAQASYMPGDAVRRAIFSQIRKEGRRLSVDEAIELARSFGDIAKEVVTELAAKGILLSQDAERHRSVRAKTTSEETISPDTAGDKLNYSTRIPTKTKDKKKASLEPARSFKSYVAELTSTAQKIRNSMIPSVISWFGINAVLWYVNITYADDIPWVIPITVTWFFGLLKKAARLVQSRNMAKEAVDMPPLTDSELKEYKAINKDRVAFLSRFFSFFSVSSLLMLINLMVDERSPWSLIP
ncbi:MAG: hypothetical protein N3A02_05245, partial [Rectinema sp.]|nr:hypothetical protein [Rectinema sp.]